MYLGTDFAEVFAAHDTQTLLVEVAEAFGEVQASNVQGAYSGNRARNQVEKPDLIACRRSLFGRPPF